VLEVGERVLSLEVATGRIVESTIVAVRRAVRECLALRWGDGGLVCTPDHPIFDPERGSYRPASDWLTGDARRLLVCSDEVAGEITVAATEVFAGVYDVVDLSLADGPHNFIAAGVVVHNKTIVVPDGPAQLEVNLRIDGPTFQLTGDGARREFRLHACIDDEDVWDGNFTIKAVAPSIVKDEDGFAASLSLQSESAVGEPEIRKVPTTLTFTDEVPYESCSAGVKLSFLQFNGPEEAVLPVTWTAEVTALHDEGTPGVLEVTIEPVD